MCMSRKVRPSSGHIAQLCQRFLVELPIQRGQLAALDGIKVDNANYMQEWKAMHQAKKMQQS